MSTKYPPRELPMDTDQLLLAFMIQFEGQYRPETLAKRRAWIEKNGNTPTAEEYANAAARAKHRYFEQPMEFFVCRSGPCREKCDGVLRDEISALLDEYVDDCAVSDTECHGPCSHAAVATLRIGARAERLAGMASFDDWRAVVDYVGRATAARTLLVDPGRASDFQFNPAHKAWRRPEGLRTLGFLVGGFEGEGRYAHCDGRFSKQVIGSWEAGGRAVSLRMSVAFPLEDGIDVHHAFVMVSEAHESNRATAQIVTDAGATVHREIAFEGDGSVVFEDHIPDRLRSSSGGSAIRARKVLVPTDAGYDEILQVEHPGSGWCRYSSVAMRRNGS